LRINFILDYGDSSNDKKAVLSPMTAQCANKGKQTATLHLRSCDSRLTRFNRTLWT